MEGEHLRRIWREKEEEEEDQEWEVPGKTQEEREEEALTG